MLLIDILLALFSAIIFIGYRFIIAYLNIKKYQLVDDNEQTVNIVRRNFTLFFLDDAFKYFYNINLSIKFYYLIFFKTGINDF
ncbi:hypothetical protein CBF29_12395 [Vagococcus elongatus]|uniref:Uncharacterized protein n=1 Tax=Vagococcus elongatus TaxID=180344 RepID=A0A430AMF7_9ENTE|nr:hypothetical protein CBF29_12395 [Vagococcus elongatus]